MKKKLATIITSAAIIGAAYVVYAQLITVAYPVAPDDLRQIIVKRMEAEGIWYREEPNGVLRVIKGNEHKIIKLGKPPAELG